MLALDIHKAMGRTMHRDPNPRRGATTSMRLIHIRDQRGIIREVQGRSIQESTRALRKGRHPVDRTRGLQEALDTIITKAEITTREHPRLITRPLSRSHLDITSNSEHTMANEFCLMQTFILLLIIAQNSETSLIIDIKLFY